MNVPTRKSFALLAAVAITCSLASAITITIDPFANARGSLVVMVSNSKAAGAVEAVRKATEGAGDALLFTDLPAGVYAVVVLARRKLSSCYLRRHSEVPSGLSSRITP